MAADKGGKLFHAGEYQQGDVMRQMLSRDNPPLYGELIHNSNIYDAVEALKKYSPEDLQSIRTFVVETWLPVISARPQMETLVGEFLKDQPVPKREMSAVFLAGKIREIFSQRGLQPPPIIMSVIDDETGNFLHIDKILDRWKIEPENTISEISRLSNEVVAERQRTRS